MKKIDVGMVFAVLAAVLIAVGCEQPGAGTGTGTKTTKKKRRRLSRG
jgi:hypothetical protein